MPEIQKTISQNNKIEREIAVRLLKKNHFTSRHINTGEFFRKMMKEPDKIPIPKLFKCKYPHTSLGLIKIQNRTF